MKSITPVERLRLNIEEASKANIEGWQNRAVNDLVSDKLNELKSEALAKVNDIVKGLNSTQKIEKLYSVSGRDREDLMGEMAGTLKLKGAALESRMIDDKLGELRTEAYEKIDDQFNSLGPVAKVEKLLGVSAEESKKMINDGANQHFNKDFASAQNGLERVGIAHKKALEQIELSKSKTKEATVSK